MFQNVRSIVSMFCVVLMLGVASGCTQTEEQKVITEIQDVVSFSTSILTVLSGYGVLSTPQEQADITLAAQYAAKLSAAASQAVTEANNTDAWNVKVTTIEGYFAPILQSAVPSIQTAKIAAAVALATSALKLLLDQLGVQSASLKGHVSVASVGTALPWTMRHKLAKVQKQANANVATAKQLLAAK